MVSWIAVEGVIIGIDWAEVFVSSHGFSYCVWLMEGEETGCRSWEHLQQGLTISIARHPNAGWSLVASVSVTVC